MSYSATETYSWTNVDVQKVVRRFRADVMMIAQSTGAITEDDAGKWAHDVEFLAKKNYLNRVDLTLFSGATEVCAANYSVDTSGNLGMNRPGGVEWPRVPYGRLRIIISYTPEYDAAAKYATRQSLLLSWTDTSEDISHSTLKAQGGREYSSNGWGFERTDFGQ